MASNRQKAVKVDETETLVMSSLSSCAMKIEESLAKIQSASTGGGSSTAETVALLSRLIEQLLSNVPKTRATVNNLQGLMSAYAAFSPQNQAAVALPSPSISPRNQGGALSLLQQSQVNYGAEFVPSAEDGYIVIVSKTRKVAPADEAVISDTFKTGEPGKIVLTIDNQTSKKKKLLYRSKPSLILIEAFDVQFLGGA